MRFGERANLGVSGEEVFEEGLRTGLEILEQEVTNVEVRIGATHLSEVDDAGVPAVAVEPYVRHVEVAVG